jgi:hypothetical protein
MTSHDSGTTDGSIAGWQEELAALLAAIEAAQAPEGSHAREAEAALLARVAGLDLDLQQFLVARMAKQESAEAAAFLDALASRAETPGVTREQARAALATMAERGIVAPTTQTESFYAGWVQQGRERGEQIMLLGWRLPDGRIEGLVFLLDWRGDGLKDFYRTREISDAEWGELVEHNGRKGAPLTAISLADGRALLEGALAESQRFSRPVPREYRLAQALIQRRILSATGLPAAPRQYVAPDLNPAAVVGAYIRALHYRDYLLVWELLAPKHSMRAQERAEGVDALRRQLKHMPRRRPDAQISLEGQSPITAQEHASVLAEGEEESFERSGRRVRQSVRERYHLRHTADGWRITAIDPA